MFPIYTKNPLEFPTRFDGLELAHDDPNNTVAIDWETYYDKEYSLTLMSSINYCMDERFYPYLVAIEGTLNGKVISYCGRPEKFDWTPLLKRPDIRFLAHNATFDEIVTWRYLTQKGIAPLEELVATFNFMCTADMAAYLKYPRPLAGLSHVLKLPAPDKTIRDRMKGVDFTNDDELTSEVLDYALGDARNTFNAWTLLHEQWPDVERDFSVRNRRRCYRGIPINIEETRAAYDAFNRVKHEAEAKIPWDWGKNKTPLSLKKRAEQCRKDNIPVPTSFAVGKCEEWENEYAPKYDWVHAARTWGQSNMHQARITRMVKQSDLDTRFMHFQQMYCGAHTGRSSGGGKMNMQNMPGKETVGGVNIRNLIEAPNDYVLMIADYDQIEPRLSYHLTGMTHVLDLIRDGMQVYEAHARATMGYTNVEPLKTYPSLYRSAKFRVIGLGYGCGAAKFLGMCPWLGTIEGAKKEVDAYRQSHQQIVEHWYTHDEWLQYSARELDPTYEFKLMSGRTFQLHTPRILTVEEEDADGNTTTRERLKVRKVRGGSFTNCWGGTVTENEMQATGMDIMKHAVSDMPVHLTNYWLLDSHDELVFCLPKKDHKDIGDEILKHMTNVPWLPDDFPLAASADYVQMYDKF